MPEDYIDMFRRGLDFEGLIVVDTSSIMPYTARASRVVDREDLDNLRVGLDKNLRFLDSLNRSFPDNAYLTSEVAEEFMTGLFGTLGVVRKLSRHESYPGSDFKWSNPERFEVARAYRDLSFARLEFLLNLCFREQPSLIDNKVVEEVKPYVSGIISAGIYSSDRPGIRPDYPSNGKQRNPDFLHHDGTIFAKAFAASYGVDVRILTRDADMPRLAREFYSSQKELAMKYGFSSVYDLPDFRGEVEVLSLDSKKLKGNLTRFRRRSPAFAI